MTVLVLTACPEKLRGHITRWLIEVSAGVFVGNVSKRVRTLLWVRVVELIGTGRALMVFSAPGEQRMSLLTHGHHWAPEDFDGLTLMRRPDTEGDSPGAAKGWSAASRRRKYGRRTGRD